MGPARSLRPSSANPPRALSARYAVATSDLEVGEASTAASLTGVTGSVDVVRCD